jgi:carbon-monoxide dehydrogenase medium subunit
VDINGITELGVVEAGAGLTIGAAVRQRMLETSADVHRAAPMIVDALRHVGHVGVRARGTVGGSVAHADPAAELPAVMLALDAAMTAVGPAGRRTVRAEEFFKGYFTTALESDELLTELCIPAAGPHARSAFLEVSRRHGDFALVGAAVFFEVIDGRASNVRIALSGVADHPVLAVTAQRSLEGKDGSDVEVRQEAARLAAAELEPPSDIHAPAWYRKEVAQVLVERALTQAMGEETDQ